MNSNIRFDDALPLFAGMVQELLGADALLDNCFLRDAIGRLTFVMLSPLDELQVDTLRTRTGDLLPYVQVDGAVLTPEDLFDPSLHEETSSLLEWIDHPAFRGFVRLVERRIVGQDWLQPPREPIEGVPPITVFASHKGGVGRSTALAVSAVALSAAGFNVLAIDMDLEAPGLGEMLLADQPEFGSLDFFVEDNLADLDYSFFDSLTYPSRFATVGSLNVVPAVGKVGNSSPQNILGKLARAYLEKPSTDGGVETFLSRTRELVRRLSLRRQYDTILIDSRAGLSEITAAAVLGLGADILLFGVDTPQTFAGFRYFLSHLERFRPSASSENDWRYRLRMVQAKAQADPAAQARFRNSAFELFSDTLYDVEEGIEEEAFNFDYDDINAPHYAWPILNDLSYSEFDPLIRAEQVSSYLYDRTFGPFIGLLREKMGLKT